MIRRSKVRGGMGVDAVNSRTGLYWLVGQTAWDARLAELTGCAGADLWPAFRVLSNVRLDALRTLRLDRKRAALLPRPPDGIGARRARVAVLATSTVDHLLPALRVGGLRRGLWIDTYTPAYGQYTQELMDDTAGLHRFAPDTVLFALDAWALTRGIQPGDAAAEVDRKIARRVTELAAQWARARQAFAAQVIQQLPLPVFTPLLGSHEHRLPWAPSWVLRRLATALRERADEDGVEVLALDEAAARDGLAAWHDPALWHRAKQEVHPTAAPLLGDLLARLLAAARGLSAKCLVLDLDNTLWGGVIGDDGLDGIHLGQGSALGEAFVAFQHHVRALARRGVILAVCSKNDEANALAPFERHPEMVLKRDDIACFIANWTDKAANLREIARRLNIGLDSLVFADDNPAERAIVRRELPMVAVPELPEDPTLYGMCLADAGYFEAVRITQEDLDRGAQYRANLKRDALAATATDLDGYLRGLKMQAVWGRFDRISLPRIVQLINKTNQFNLTSERTTDEQISALIADDRVLTLQIRLLDQFGDNGIVAIVHGGFRPDNTRLDLRAWLMSCRVLGRQLEEATLNLVVAEAKRLGATHLRGLYRPTARNGMVREHYARLGFALLATAADGDTTWELDLAGWSPRPTHVASRTLGAMATRVPA